MKNRNTYIDRELLGAVIGGGEVLLIIGYLVLSWFGIVFQQRVIIPLIVLLAFVFVLIVSSLNRLDTLNLNYCFDYINHIRGKKIKNTIIQSNVVYYIEQLIKENRVIDAKKLLYEAKDILSATDIKLYSAILNKQYKR